MFLKKKNWDHKYLKTHFIIAYLIFYASLTASLIFLKPELESVLRRHKSQFVSLLKNPIRNSSDAALVRKASSEGIKLNTGEGSTMTQRLPPQIVDEAFIISDMFELNEISSLQLLLQGTITIWIPDTWIPDSMGVQDLNG